MPENYCPHLYKLAEQLGQLLTNQQLMLTTAESCTGLGSASRYLSGREFRLV